MTADEYQQEALRTVNSELTQIQQLTEGIVGMSGETGECVDILKKHLFQGHDLDKNELALELGDVAWYLAVSAWSIGYGLDDIFRMNIEKLKKRYPDGFETNRSIYRVE